MTIAPILYRNQITIIETTDLAKDHWDVADEILRGDDTNLLGIHLVISEISFLVEAENYIQSKFPENYNSYKTYLLELKEDEEI